MFRIPLGIVLAAFLSFPAQESGKGDLKPGYAALMRDDEAIADFGRALFFKPDFAEVYVARADVYLRSGRRIEALADYRRAVREKPDVLRDYPGIAAKMAMLGATPEPFER